MIKVDLITGFLGSGKTTFLIKYVKYLISQGKKVAVLENDFGAVNIDMILLSELEKEGCELEMVAGGCDKDCHIRRFKTKLISLGMRGFDRVIIEPSGIFDMDEFFDVLRDEPLERWYEIGNVFSIVDANIGKEDLGKASRYLLASQTAFAGKVLISKLNADVDTAGLQCTIDYIQTCLQEFQCKREVREAIFAKDWQEVSGEDFEMLLESGYVNASFQKLWFDEKEAFSSIYLWHVKMPVSELEKHLQKLFRDTKYGHIIRIKGFMPREDGSYIMLNATSKQLDVKEIEKAQEVIIVIGEDLQEEAIREELNAFEEC